VLAVVDRRHARGVQGVLRGVRGAAVPLQGLGAEGHADRAGPHVRLPGAVGAIRVGAIRVGPVPVTRSGRLGPGPSSGNSTTRAYGSGNTHAGDRRVLTCTS